MANKIKKKCYELPICNKETIALSLHLLQESIKDLKNSRNCNNFSQNYENTDNTAKDTRYLKDYKFNVFKKKTKEPLNEKNSNNEQAKSAKCEKKGLKNTNSKNDFESLNSEQLQMLTHTLLNSLIEKHQQKKHTNLVHSNGFVSSNETLKEGYKSTKQSKIASNKNCNKYINSHSKSSQLKENDSKISKRNGQSMSFKMNISGLPFISGKSTAKSYSLSANLQEVLHLMKHHNKKNFQTKPFVSTCHRSCLCDKQHEDIKKSNDKENLFDENFGNYKYEMNSNNQCYTHKKLFMQKHDKHESYQEEIDGHYYLETLVEELHNKLARLKTRRTYKQLSPECQDEIKALNIEIELKKKQLLEIENLMDKEYVSVSSQRIEKPHKNQKNIGNNVENLINQKEKYTCKHSSALNSSDNVRRSNGVVPTAKQKYISLLKDLQQIQTSLRNDVN